MSDETFTDWKSFIICPACGEVDKEMTDYPDGLERDGDMDMWTCPHCEAEAEVMLSVECSYSTRLKPSPGGGRTR